MTAPLGRIVIYTKKVEEMADFYARDFNFTISRIPGDRIVELTPEGSGIALLLHPAFARQREGQALIKLVFDVEDVPGFSAAARENGLRFGALHKADGYVFANAKDPAGNSIQVSSRAFATSAQ